MDEQAREQYEKTTLSNYQKIWGRGFRPPFPRLPESDDAQHPIRIAQGELMGRDILDLKTRAVIIFSVLVALGMKAEAKLYIQGLRNLGYSVREIAEMIAQISLYAGVPRGIDAHMMLKEVVDEDEQRTRSEGFFYRFPGQ